MNESVLNDMLDEKALFAQSSLISTFSVYMKPHQRREMPFNISDGLDLRIDTLAVCIKRKSKETGRWETIHAKDAPTTFWFRLNDRRLDRPLMDANFNDGGTDKEKQEAMLYLGFLPLAMVEPFKTGLLSDIGYEFNHIMPEKTILGLQVVNLGEHEAVVEVSLRGIAYYKGENL